MRGRSDTAEKPPYAWIPLGRLTVLDEHQGRLYPATVKALRARWRGVLSEGKVTLPGAFQVVPVNGSNLERGQFHVADGRHRREVCRELYSPDAKVLCEITWHATDADRSALYLRVNNQHSRHPLDKYWQGVRAGQEHEEFANYAEIDQTLHAVGLHVGTEMGHNSVRCPAALVATHARGGTALLANTLTLIRATWPDDQDRWIDAIVEGLGILLLRHGPEIDRDAFAKKLGKVTCKTVIGRARGSRDAWPSGVPMPFGKTVPAHVALVIRGIYDQGRRVGRLGGDAE